MQFEYNVKQSFWEGDVFGRLTPPPEDFLEMEQDFFKPNINPRQDGEPAIEVESSSLDLEFESICAGVFDGFKSGPTLAELNETRSRSPLINPEMKRLHQAAIGTVDEGSDETCRHALPSARSYSVLEQQLKTQATTSIYHEQFFPSRSNCNVQLSSTVSQSELIEKPGRHIRTPRLQVIKTEPLSPPPTAPKERKAFADGYKTHGVSSQLSSPPFENNYNIKRDDFGLNSRSSCAPTARSCDEQKGYVLGKQVSEQNFTADEQEKTAEQYEASEDEDFESEEEVEDAEEYCPYDKAGKTPTRRKGRKSESEDMVPNPIKLLNIGRELDRLNKIISNLKPINELPQHSRGRSRKEKNKLASRACRLKKKQQHEANKVKLHGLESEQENLQFIINDMKKEIVSWAASPRTPANPLNEKFQDMAKKALAQQIAGHTTEFVRKVLQEVAKGSQTGGLQLLKRT